MLVDSCFICTALVWKSVLLCKPCRKLLFETNLLIRQQGNLEIISLLDIKGVARTLIYECKYGKNLPLLHMLTEILLEKLASEISMNGKFLGVIPIPPTKIGTKDHAYYISVQISDFLKIPFYPNALKRPLGAHTGQKNKSLAERTNVKFESVLDKYSQNPGVWLLVDDVITTGLTLLEANKALGNQDALCLTLASRPYVLLNT